MLHKLEKLFALCFEGHLANACTSMDHVDDSQYVQII